MRQGLINKFDNLFDTILQSSVAFRHCRAVILSKLSDLYGCSEL